MSETHTRRRRWTCGVATLGMLVLGACNLVSGADDIVFDDSDDDDGSPIVGVGGGGTSSTSTSGVGGGSSTSTSSTSTSSTSTGSTSTGSTSSSSSTTSSGCTYPSGPYGVTTGSTVSPNLSWQGYDEGPIGQVTTISMQDYFDCDGALGINALMVETSQYG